MIHFIKTNYISKTKMLRYRKLIEIIYLEIIIFSILNKIIYKNLIKF